MNLMVVVFLLVLNGLLMYEFQVDTIQLLQRLYDELTEKEDECQLDRYSSSEKAGRLGLTILSS